MERLKIKIINRSGHELPSYGTFEAAGMDVRAFLPAGPLTLKPFERALIQTGLYMELPAGYECQIRPRSGLALKHGLTVLNTPGTIDADYRGEIGVILINLGNQVPGGGKPRSCRHSHTEVDPKRLQCLSPERVGAET